jgi:hypothetical protein
MKIASIIAIVGLASAANAGVLVYNFGLNSAQENNPANTSPATGSMTLTLDDVSGAFSLSYNYQGMIGNLTVAHFHRAAAGVNGPVFYWLAATGAPAGAGIDKLLSPSLATGGKSGSGTGNGTFTSAQIADVKAGLVYANLHTTTFGGGEIRGQVVPAPAALSLAGIAGLAAFRRRR